MFVDKLVVGLSRREALWGEVAREGVGFHGSDVRLNGDGEEINGGADADAAGCFVMVRLFFFSSRRRHTRLQGDWSSDVCSSDLSTVLTTRCTRSMTSAKSKSTCMALKPNSRGRFACATSRADLIRAFEGTQPVLRQSPPILSFSISVTLALTAAAM